MKVMIVTLSFYLITIWFSVCNAFASMYDLLIFWLRKKERRNKMKKKTNANEWRANRRASVCCCWSRNSTAAHCCWRCFSVIFKRNDQSNHHQNNTKFNRWQCDCAMAGEIGWIKVFLQSYDCVCALTWLFYVYDVCCSSPFNWVQYIISIYEIISSGSQQQR